MLQNIELKKLIKELMRLKDEERSLLLITAYITDPINISPINVKDFEIKYNSDFYLDISFNDAGSLSCSCNDFYWDSDLNTLVYFVCPREKRLQAIEIYNIIK